MAAVTICSDFGGQENKVSHYFHCLSNLHLVVYMGKQWKQYQTLFFWAPKSLQMVTAAMKLKDAYSLEGKL